MWLSFIFCQLLLLTARLPLPVYHRFHMRYCITAILPPARKPGRNRSKGRILPPGSLRRKRGRLCNIWAWLPSPFPVSQAAPCGPPPALPAGLSEPVPADTGVLWCNLSHLPCEPCCRKALSIPYSLMLPDKHFISISKFRVLYLIIKYLSAVCKVKIRRNLAISTRSDMW